MTGPPAATPAPAWTRACDAGVVAFAGFTVLANGAVALGGSLDQLIGASGVTLAACLALGALWRLRAGRVDAGPGAANAPSREASRARDERLAGGGPGRRADDALRGPLLAGACVAVVVHLLTGSFAAYSACGLALALGALARSSDPGTLPTPRVPRGSAAVLLALAGVCAVAASIAHYADADDSFYVNLVVAAADRPDAPLLAGDTMHGVEGAPMALPVFRVLSFELLQAIVVRLTGIDAITWVHVVTPPLAAMLAPFAYARLGMLLLPARWLAAVVCMVVGFLALGDGAAAWSDFALLRLQQGKSLMLHVALPLVAAYAIRFALAPGRRAFLLLLAAQIGAMGLSSSGLWLAPAVAGLGLLGALPWRDPARRTRSLRRLAAGLASCAYPLGVALALRAETRRAFEQAVHPLESLTWAGDRLSAWATELVAGDGLAQTLLLFAVPASLAAARGALFRRWAAVALAVFFGLFFNPWTAPFVAQHVAGPDTYFRVFWLIPVPLLLAAVLTAPLDWPLPARLARPALRAAAAIAVAGLALGLLPEVRTLSAGNGVRIARPGPKLPPAEWAAARAVARYARPGEAVLAPTNVSRWIPLLHDHPAALMVREMHLDRLYDLLGPEELERRLVLTHLVTGDVGGGEAGAALLAEALDGYPLQVVCLGGRALGRPGLRRVLLDSALEVRVREPEYEIWARRERPVRGGDPASAPR